jgi:hypothetical protein
LVIDDDQSSKGFQNLELVPRKARTSFFDRDRKELQIRFPRAGKKKLIRRKTHLKFLTISFQIQFVPYPGLL